MTIRKLLICAALTALTGFFGCDLGKTVNQAQARKAMVATLIGTPEFRVAPEAIAIPADSGFVIPDGGTLPDGGQFQFDGGFDGGAFFADGGIVVPAQTIALAFFGERKGESLDIQPEGITGAVITVQPNGGTLFTLKEQSGGNHALNSQDDKNFVYQQDATYVFKAATPGEVFVAQVEKVPSPEKIQEFRPGGKSFIEHTRQTQFVFRRPDPPLGQERNLGFVLVAPIGADGKQGDATYTNVPKDAVGFLKLVAAPQEWKQTIVTIPASAFPEANKNYVIVLQSAKLGGPTSENLFSGSAIIAGTADVGVVKTRP